MTLAAPLARPRALDTLLPADLLFWAVLALIAAVVPPWERMLSVEIAGSAQMLGVVLFILGVRAAYVTVRPGAPTIHTVLETGAGVIAYTAVVAPVSYLCARNDRALVNDYLHGADVWLGFDWQAWTDTVIGSPALSLVLRLAYVSLLPQTVLVLTVLPLVGDGRRGYSLIRASLIAVLIACAFSYATPAAMPEAAGTSWYPDWSALRSVAPFRTSLSHVEGVISFPSFHAAMAVLLFHSMRGLGAVTVVFGAVEALMLVATPVFGAHYLVDVIGGIVVAGFAVWLTAWLDRRVPVRRARDQAPAGGGLIECRVGCRTDRWIG